MIVAVTFVLGFFSVTFFDGWSGAVTCESHCAVNFLPSLIMC